MTCPSCRSTVELAPGDVVVSRATSRVAYLHDGHIRWQPVRPDVADRLLDVGCVPVEEDVVADPIGLLRALAVLEAAETVADLWADK